MAILGQVEQQRAPSSNLSGKAQEPSRCAASATS